MTIHDSQPRDVAGTDYADYRLNQLVLRAELRADAAICARLASAVSRRAASEQGWLRP